MTPRAHKIRPTRGEVPEAPVAPRSLLVVHAAELLTLRGPPGPRIHGAASDLGQIEDGAVYAEGDRIRDVGPTADVLSRHPRADLRIDATEKVVLPGFVDAHTHLVFAGSRAHEVEWKAKGLSYAEIAAQGGGILHTVQATREASEESLARDGARRLRSMRSFGTTTVEAKSGYGLRTADELKLLRAMETAGRLADVDVVPTFLGAHAIPPEFAGRPDAYVESVEGEMLDAVVAGRSAVACDAFVDKDFFTPEQARRILRKAGAAGLRVKVHAEELEETGGAALAAELGAVSADHLNHVSAAGIEALARAGVVAVLLPATSLTSRLPFADGRRLIAAGVPVALGTDFSPNTWCESMQLAIALACHHNRLTAAEAIVAATINAARATGRDLDVGSLEPGKRADLVILNIPSASHLGYRLGSNAVETVVRQGHVVEDRRGKR